MSWIATILLLLSQFLVAQRNIHNFWVGILGSILFIVFFTGVHMWAPVTLNVAFIALNSYGWLHWHKLEKSKVKT